MNNKFYRYSPSYWPTQEELLEVNTRSIISDCRALISGNLTPRSLGNISSSWYDYAPQKVRMRRIDSIAEHAELQRPIGERKSIRRRIEIMARLLVLEGLDPVIALEKATELLTRRGEK